MVDLKADKNRTLSDTLSRKMRERFKAEVQHRENASGILSDGQFEQIRKQLSKKKGFQDVMQTTMGNALSQQGLLRPITNEDLHEFDRKINALSKAYQGGIKASQIINLSLPIDRSRANKEIPWAHPISSRYNVGSKSLIVSFMTAASGKYGETKHFVNVEFTQFRELATHRLQPSAPKRQAETDAKLLKDSLLKFDCDCGRHTYWYRYIASVGKFAYIGANPIGREETGFPKIRNPNLKGVACKHVLRTMLVIQNNKAFQDFLVKAILKQNKQLDTKKDTVTKANKKEIEQSIAKQQKYVRKVVSEKEKAIKRNLYNRYQKALANGRLTRNAKDRKSTREKLNVLSKLHSIEAYLKLIS